MSYFFSDYNSAKQFANKKYNEISEKFGKSSEKINDTHYYIYENEIGPYYFEIKIDEINFNPNNKDILFECGQQFLFDKEYEEIYTRSEIAMVCCILAMLCTPHLLAYLSEYL